MTAEEREKQLVAAREQQEKDDRLKLMRTPEGRRVLYSIIDGLAGAFRDCFCKEDTHRTAYLEGRRSIALVLIEDLQRVAPAEYVHMLGEAASRAERERLELESIRKEKQHGG